jgi:two-component system sensor histidine kinase KdpD
MRQTAHAAEARDHGDGRPDATAASSPRRECLLLTIDASPTSAALIRRGRRVADYLEAECLAVFVSRTADLHDLAPEARESVERHLNFARGLRIESRILEGDDAAQTLVGFARLHGVTQIFLTRRREGRIPAVLGRGLVQRIVALASDMQVTIVASRRP